MIDRQALLLKVAAMFRPSHMNFAGHMAADVICGPNDRALVGYDTYFTKTELTEDFGFTPEEAEFFIATVRAINELADAEQNKTGDPHA